MNTRMKGNERLRVIYRFDFIWCKARVPLDNLFYSYSPMDIYDHSDIEQETPVIPTIQDRRRQLEAFQAGTKSHSFIYLMHLCL